MSINKQQSALPDIEIYGGDTTPWEVEVVCDDSSEFQADALSEYSAILTFSKIGTSSGLSTNAVGAPVLLIKNGVFSKTDAGTFIKFSFYKDDTKHLRGKFVYQIEIKHNNDLRLCQGHVYIRQNINIADSADGGTD